MSADEDLSHALVHLLRDRGQAALDTATRWPDSPVAKCIIFLTYSFRFLEATKAADVFGGITGMMETAMANGFENCFLKGYGALLKNEPDTAISIFNFHTELALKNQFILFGIALAERMKKNVAGVEQVLARMEVVAPGHPLLSRFREEFQPRVTWWQKLLRKFGKN